MWRDWLRSKWLNKLNILVWSCCWKRLLYSIFCFRISMFDLVLQTAQRKGSYYFLYFQYKHLLLLNPPHITRSGIQYCIHWEKRKTIIFYYIYQEHFRISRSSFVNDDDIKGIAKKFCWEYLMYCLFLGLFFWAAFFSEEIEAHYLTQPFFLVFEWPPWSLNPKGFIFFNKKIYKMLFWRNVEDRILNFKPIFLRMYFQSFVVFNLK